MLCAILDRQLAAILPATDDFRGYQRIDCLSFWDHWHHNAPISTKMGLYGGSLLLFIYCKIVGIFRPASLEQHLSNCLHANSFTLRQSALLLKTMAALAFFSNVETQNHYRSGTYRG